MVTEGAVRAALAEVEDPELPVGIVDLGMVRRVAVDRDRGRVTVGLTYTSIACPCVDLIREDVVARVGRLEGVEEVVVEDVLEAWSRDDVTPQGRELLRALAVV